MKESSLIEKAKNQILVLSITALVAGLGMNFLFISSINERFKSVERTLEKVEIKIDRLDQRATQTNTAKF